MGWTYMRSLGGHATPKDYLDAQFTFETSDASLKVLRSELADDRVYYAAVERLPRAGGDRIVFGLVCLVDHDPQWVDRFGYKDMTETMGPYYWDCPVEILDLLTPAENAFAVEWRRKCRERAAAQAVLSLDT